MSRSDRGYHHGSLAAALEQAAMVLLERQPAGEISLREVARVAGVSHNAPYHHFGDRRALLKVLGERSMAALVEKVRRAAASGGPNALLRAGTAYIDFALDRPYAFDAIYDPQVCVPGEPTETMAPLIEELSTVLNDAAAGLGRSAPAEQNAIWAQLQGLAQLGQAGHLTPAQVRASWKAAARVWAV